MDLFEALYSMICRYLIGLFETSNFILHYIDFLCESLDQVWVIQDRQQTTQSRQMSYADHRVYFLRFELVTRSSYEYRPKGRERFGSGGKINPRYI